MSREPPKKGTPGFKSICRSKNGNPCEEPAFKFHQLARWRSPLVWSEAASQLPLKGQRFKSPNNEFSWVTSRQKDRHTHTTGISNNLACLLAADLAGQTPQRETNRSHWIDFPFKDYILAGLVLIIDQPLFIDRGGGCWPLQKWFDTATRLGPPVERLEQGYPFFSSLF